MPRTLCAAIAAIAALGALLLVATLPEPGDFQSPGPRSSSGVVVSQAPR